jgi:DNA-binding LacI/PurR family transcriptional regulator
MSTTTPKSKYVQLADLLRERIHSGELKVGDRLPSYADLNREHGAATATVQRACDLLEQDDLIERRNGSGVYVAQPTRKRTGNIGFIGSLALHTRRTPASLHLMEGIQRALESDQHLLYLGEADSWTTEACDKVDGVLICNNEETPEILEHLPSHLPRVSVLYLTDNTSCVGVDDFGGARMAIRHLLGLGHRRISCLLEKNPSEVRRRFAGYCDALQENDIEFEPAWIRLTKNVHQLGQQWTTEQPYREWARLEMSAWLRKGWRELGCTAILVQNDAAAIGVIQVLQKEGIKVPEQVSVIGFDGTEICDLISPSVSAVALPFEQIGTTAMQILNRQISGESLPNQAILLPVSLRPGASVGSTGTH